MNVDARMSPIDRMTFTALFSVDWLFGQEQVAKLLPRRWETLHHRMLAKAARTGDGSVYPVERRCGLTPVMSHFSADILVSIPGRPRHKPLV